MTVKLPLAVRKDLRDNWENQLPTFTEQWKTSLGEPYVLDPSLESFYQAAEPTSHVSKLGKVITAYFREATKGIERLTESGKNQEVVTLFNSLVPNRKVVVVFDKDAGYAYCGPRFQNGDYQIVIHPGMIFMNVDRAGNEQVDQQLDIALFKQKGELPYSTRRAEQTKLNVAVEKAKADIKKMFDEDYTFEYDVPALFKASHEQTRSKEASEENWFRRYAAWAPNMLALYIAALVKGLEDKKFGSDEMLREALTEAVEKKVIAFQIKDKLPAGKYNAVEIDDGKLVMYTTIERFGSNIDGRIVDGLADLL